MSAAYAMTPYGVHYTSGDMLYKAFVKPFVDVVDVAVGKTKEMSQRVQTLAKVGFEAVATSLLPFLTSDYKEIFDKEKEELDKIRNEYSEVYAATWDAFKQTDVALTAFFCYPGAVLTGVMAKKAPDVALRMLGILSGGTLDSWIEKVRKAIGGGFGTGKSSKDHFESPAGGYGGGGTMGMDYMYGFDYGGGGGYGGTHESVIREDDQKKNKKQKVVDLITSEKVVKKALSSPEAQRMQKKARAAVHNTLKTVLEHAQAVCTAKSVEELQKKIGKPLKGLDKLQQAKPEERQAAEQQMLATVKKSMKEFYVKSLEGNVKQVLEAGIPKNSGYVRDYESVIQKIKSF
jgi:hypothetical protein